MAPPAPASIAATYVHGDGSNISMRVEVPPVSGAQGYEWERWDGVADQWVQLGRSGSPAFTDSTIIPDRIYNYACRAYDGSGTGQPVYTSNHQGFVRTRPLAPISVTVRRLPGNVLEVTWPDRSRSEETFEVEHWWGAIEGGFQVVATGIAGDGLAEGVTRSFQHSGTDAATRHRYRVRARNSAGASEWSDYSNWVYELTGALAPRLIYPLTVHRQGTAVTYQWEHNPFDGTPQTEFELQDRPKGATDWANTWREQSSAQSRSGHVLGVGDYEWRVRTWGEAPTDGYWSNPQPYRVAVGPGDPSLISPAVGTWGQDKMYISWVFAHNGGASQGAFEVEVLVGGEKVAGALEYSTASGWWSKSVLQSGTSATVRVRVQNTAGLWSGWVSRTVPVEYQGPPAASVSAVWDEMAQVRVTYSTPQPTGGAPAAFDAAIQRRVGSGGWETLATDRSISGTYVDSHAPLSGGVQYRVVTYAQIGTSTVSAPASPGEPTSQATDSWITLTDPSGAVARIRSAPSLDDDLQTGWTFRHFDTGDGIATPMPSSGEVRQGTVTGSLIHLRGAIHGGASPASQFRTLARSGDLLLRAPTGLFAWVRVTSVAAKDDPGITRLSFSWREVPRS